MNVSALWFGVGVSPQCSLQTLQAQEVAVIFSTPPHAPCPPNYPRVLYASSARCRPCASPTIG